MHIQRNETAQRFETTVEGQLAVLEYRMTGHSIMFTHTGVPPAIEGRGIGSALTKAGLEYARAQGLKVVPQCPFVQAYLAKHSEYSGFVD